MRPGFTTSNPVVSSHSDVLARAGATGAVIDSFMFVVIAPPSSFVECCHRFGSVKSSKSVQIANCCPGAQLHSLRREWDDLSTSLPFPADHDGGGNVLLTRVSAPAGSNTVSNRHAHPSHFMLQTSSFSSFFSCLSLFSSRQNRHESEPTLNVISFQLLFSLSPSWPGCSLPG